MTLNLLPEEFAEFLTVKFHSEEKPKNNRMHFSNYEDAITCMEGLRALIPKAIETNNLFLAE
jgi:hypothetical protein